jgi:hypothetical protein
MNNGTIVDFVLAVDGGFKYFQESELPTHLVTSYIKGGIRDRFSFGYKYSQDT